MQAVQRRCALIPHLRPISKEPPPRSGQRPGVVVTVSLVGDGNIEDRRDPAQGLPHTVTTPTGLAGRGGRHRTPLRWRSELQDRASGPRPSVRTGSNRVPLAWEPTSRRALGLAGRSNGPRTGRPRATGGTRNRGDAKLRVGSRPFGGTRRRVRSRHRNGSSGLLRRAGAPPLLAGPGPLGLLACLPCSVVAVSPLGHVAPAPPRIPCVFPASNHPACAISVWMSSGIVDHGHHGLNGRGRGPTAASGRAGPGRPGHRRSCR